MSPSASDPLRVGGAQIALTEWRVVVVEGRHRERFLNSQLTSDIKGLQIGSSQPTALLDRSGRLQAFGFAAKMEDRLELLVPAGAVDSLTSRLEAFIIADDVTLTVRDDEIPNLALGAEAVRILSGCQSGSVFPIEGWGSRGFVVRASHELDLPELDASEFETRRVLSGLPKWGSEAGVGTPIYETTLVETAVSFEKGCYLGQETVAKVASGRGAARAPMLLELASGTVDVGRLIGRSFSIPEKNRAGEIVSFAVWNGSPYVVAKLVRDLRVSGRHMRCSMDDGTTFEATVHSLPFLEPPYPDRWAHDLNVKAAAAFSGDHEDEAMVLLERAIAICPQNPDAYESLGVIHGRHGRYPEAIEWMKRLLAVDPESVMAHTNLSLYYNQLGRIEDAEREAGDAMRAGMRREKSQREREVEAAENAEASAADRARRADLFRQVLDLDPDDALANFGLGELCVEEQKFDDAIDLLERALVVDPRYSAALLALGKAHQGSGDIEAARKTFEGGIKIAAAKGDLMTANKMQERLVALDSNETD